MIKMIIKMDGERLTASKLYSPNKVYSSQEVVLGAGHSMI